MDRRRLFGWVNPSEVLVISLLTLVVTGLTSVFHLLHTVDRELEGAEDLIASLGRSAASVAGAVLTDDPDSASQSEELTRLLQAALRAPGIAYIGLTDPDGRLASAAPKDMTSLPDEAVNLTEIRQRLLPLRLVALWSGGLVVGDPIPVMRAGRAVGSIHVGLDASLLAPELKAAITGSGIVAAVALVLSFFGAFVVRWLSTPALAAIGERLDALRPDSSSGQPARRKYMGLSELGEQLEALGQELESERVQALTQRQSFEGLLDVLQDGIVLLNDDASLLFFNRACEPLVQSQLADVAGRPLEDVLPADHPMLELVRGAREEGPFERRQMHFPDSSRFREALVSAHVIEPSQSLVLLFEDVEMIRVVESLLGYGSSSILIVRASRRAVHDVGNPLHTMRLHLALLRTSLEEGTSDGALEHLRPIDGAVAGLEAVVREFFESVETRADVDEEDVVIDELLGVLVAFLRPEAAEQGIELKLASEGREAVVRSSRAVLVHLFLNVLKNALEASEAGGTILTEVSCRDGEVHVDVRDDGRGIRPDECERVFGLGVSTKADGQGIGLTVVRQVARDLGGEATIAPASGGGAIVHVRLPVNVEPARSPADESGRP